MRIKPKFKTKVIMALLLLGIVINGISFLLFRNIMNIIHGTLYNYGLLSSLDWLVPIWSTSHLFMFSITLASILFAISIPLVLTYNKNRSIVAKSTCYLLLMAEIVVGVISVYSFYIIDNLVNSTLYNYGLQFSIQWAQTYWTYTRSIIISLSVSIVSALVSFLLIFVGSQKKLKITAVKLISPTLVIVAVFALTVSIILTNSILALIGISLIFWGLIFLYVRTEEYVKRNLMDITISSQKSTINQLLKHLSLTGKPVYLPPKYFKDTGTSKAYIPKNQSSTLPPIGLIQKQENQNFMTALPGILITPSGAELVKQFETILETNFTKVNLQYLQQRLPPLLIENLEIAQNFEMQIENNKVLIEITNSIYNSASAIPENQKIESEIENPLTSALACSLAKATGQPVKIEKIQVGANNRDFIEFRILSDEVMSK
jgi:hypothetical protein